jgi:hypothetical protein
MSPDPKVFAVQYGLGGINALAQFLNASHLHAAWHFARGSRFDQDAMTITFDDPADLLPTLQRYQHLMEVGPAPK